MAVTAMRPIQDRLFVLRMRVPFPSVVPPGRSWCGVVRWLLGPRVCGRDFMIEQTELPGRLERGEKSRNGWTARCPAHDDQESSLFIRHEDEVRWHLEVLRRVCARGDRRCDRDRRVPVAAGPGRSLSPPRKSPAGALVPASHHAGCPAAHAQREARPQGTPRYRVGRVCTPLVRGPVGETEVTLTEFWSEVLGVERVGRRDHFFELGRHSFAGGPRHRTDAPARPLRRRPGAAHPPTLAEMAATVSDEPIEVAVPENLITDDRAGRAWGRADDFELLL